MTQNDVNNAVNQVVNQLTASTPKAFPNGTYMGECTVPIVWYLDALNIPVPAMANDRADGWGTDFPATLAPYFTHEAYQAGNAYPEGTVLMWNSPHIAIVVSSDGSNSVKVFEQNADPDGAPCQIANRVVNNQYHTCTYALVPIVSAPIVEASAPVVSSTLPKTCTYERITPKTMVTNKQPTTWWNLDATAWPDFKVAATIDINVPFNIAGIAHHELGSNYYMAPQDFGEADITGVPVNNNGVNEVDLSDAPAPAAAPPIEEVPAPTPVPTMPAAPVPPANIIYTKLSEQLDLVVNKNPTNKWDLGFTNDTQVTSVEQIPEGTSFVAYGKAQRTDGDKPCYYMNANDFGEADTTGIPAANCGVNTVDLSTPPAIPTVQTQSPQLSVSATVPTTETGEKVPVTVVPADPNKWMQTFTKFMNPMKYYAALTTVIHDAQGLHADQHLLEGLPVSVIGTFIKDGEKFYRTVIGLKNSTWYAIPESALLSEKDKKDDDLLDEMYNAADTIRKDAGKLTSHEKLLTEAASVEGFFKKLFHSSKK